MSQGIFTRAWAALALLAACVLANGAQAATLLAYYRMEDAAWNGTAGEWRDSHGSYHGNTGASSVSPQPTLRSASPARPGNPGTCGYGYIPSQIGGTDGTPAFTTPELPVNTAPGAATSVSFWMKWNGASDVSFIRWDRYALYVRGGRFGFTTSNWSLDIYGTARPHANQWVHVAAVFANNDILGSELYLNGVKQTLSSSPGYHNNAGAFVTPTLHIAKRAYNDHRRYVGDIDEVKVFNGALTQAQVTALYNETHPCPGAPTPPQALNAVDAGAHPVSGAITTKTAGLGFGLDIHALNAARTAVDTGVNGDVLVDLLANTVTGVTLDANNCPVSGTALTVGTVTLTAGRGSATAPAQANVWRDVRVRLRYPASGPHTLTACSADNFAIKPATLTAVASDADWNSPGTARTLDAATATATPVHKAGAPFTLRLTARNNGGIPSSQYDGSPTAQVACRLPATCTPGTLNPGAFTASGGTLTSHTAVYSEVGAMDVTFIDSSFAAVDADDTPATCAGYHLCSATVTVGRFVPDHFDVSANLAAFAPGCGSFTYLGQSFGWRTPLMLTVTANNRDGQPTLNYNGSLWKITPATLTGQTWSAAAGTIEAVGGLPAPAVTELGGGQGRIDVAVGMGLRFSRTARVAPFDASLNFSLHVADAEGVTPTVHPYTHSGIGFDDGNPATSQDARMRFGRLRLQNAHGSDLLTLPVPMTSQYWNGQGFVTNGGDHCTSLPAPTLTFFPQTANNQLASGETAASQNTPFVAGNGDLRLSAPGAGNYGYADVGANAPEWLRYDWDGIDQGGDGALHDDNPRARATFGKRNSGGRLIIRREIY